MHIFIFMLNHGSKIYNFLKIIYSVVISKKSKLGQEMCAGLTICQEQKSDNEWLGFGLRWMAKVKKSKQWSNLWSILNGKVCCLHFGQSFRILNTGWDCNRLLLWPQSIWKWCEYVCQTSYNIKVKPVCLFFQCI